MDPQQLDEPPRHLYCAEALDDSDDGYDPDGTAYAYGGALERRGSTSTTESSMSPPSAPLTPAVLAAQPVDEALAMHVMRSLSSGTTASAPASLDLRTVLRQAVADHVAKRPHLVLLTPGFGYLERHEALRLMLWSRQRTGVSFEAVAVGMHVLDRFVLARPDLVYLFPLAAIVAFGVACKYLYDSVLVRLCDLHDLLIRYPGHGAAYAALKEHAKQLLTVLGVRDLEIVLLNTLGYAANAVTATGVAVQLLPYVAVPPVHQCDVVLKTLACVRITSATNELLHFAPHTVALAAVRCAMALVACPGWEAAFAASAADILACSPADRAFEVRLSIQMHIEIIKRETTVPRC
jgi:hypothetical protein